jgi:tryptophan synthase alpha chain
MNKLERYFKDLISKGKKLFLPYVTLGDPDIPTSIQIIEKLKEAGANGVEIGIPFSDPLADGPTIQKAVKRALDNGVSLKDGFEVVRELRKRNINIPLLFMSYYNPILAFGLDKFLKEAGKVGLDGLIIPDLPPEEAGSLIKATRDVGLALVFFISPTTPLQRLKQINKASTGFVYYISLTGVTGARERLPSDLERNLKIVRKEIDKPLLVGFGISKPSQVKSIIKYADGIIIGSAIVNIVERNLKDKRRLLRQVYEFAKAVRGALEG